MEPEEQSQMTRPNPQSYPYLRALDIRKHPQVAYAGWAHKAPHRPRCFVGYSKKPVPGPDGKDCYLAVILAREKGPNGHRMHVPLQATCFTSRQRAVRASLLLQARLLGLRTPIDGNGRAELTRDEAKALKKAIKHGSAPASLCAHSPFPFPKKEEKKPILAAASEAPEKASPKPVQILKQPEVEGFCHVPSEQELSPNTPPSLSPVRTVKDSVAIRCKAKLLYAVWAFARVPANLLHVLWRGIRSIALHARCATR